MGCAMSLPRCERAPDALAQGHPRGADASNDVVTAANRAPDAGSTERVALPPGWRAVDGGYVHTVVRSGEPYVSRNEQRGGYTLDAGLRRTSEEVFTTVPPQATIVMRPSGFQCHPTTFCVHGARRAAPGVAAAAGASRCAPTSGVKPEHLIGAGSRGQLDIEATRRERQAFRGDVCCYEWRRFCGGGRLLMRKGRAIVAESVVRGPLVATPAGIDGSAIQRESAEARRALAAQWARAASFEHASIASFDEALAELAALGAPASLLDVTRRCRGDEVRHAEALYGLASALAGVTLGPGEPSVSARAPRDLVGFARALFVEACANETIAVAHAQAALDAATIEPSVAALLRGVVDDELTHMELAWRTLAWCVSAGGDAVRAVIDVELAALERSLEGEPTSTDDGLDADLRARWGLLAAPTQERVRCACVRGVIVPCAEALLHRRHGADVEGSAPRVPLTCGARSARLAAVPSAARSLCGFEAPMPSGSAV
jgi:hypothetical protein